MSSEHPSPGIGRAEPFTEHIEHWRTHQWTNPGLAYLLMLELEAEIARLRAEIEELKRAYKTADIAWRKSLGEPF